MTLRASSFRPALACAALAAALLSGAAHAGIATHVASVQPWIGQCHPRHLGVAANGDVLVTDSQSLTRFNSSWSPVFHVLGDQTPASPPDIFVGQGAVELLDGRLLAFDFGGSTYYGWSAQPRFSIWNDPGPPDQTWNVNPGSTSTSTPEMASNGDVFIAAQSAGIATISRWSPAGALVTSWTVATTAGHLAIQDDVVYLAGDSRGKIFKFDLSGAPIATLSTTLRTVTAIDLDDAGRLYLLQPPAFGTGSMIAILSPAGVTIDWIETPGPGGAFSAPTDLVVAGSKLYVADPTWYYGAIHEFRLDMTVPAAPTSWGRVKSRYR